MRAGPAALGARRRPARAARGAQPFVHQQGTALVDGDGLPVNLRGVNLGGRSTDGQRKLLSRPAELVGDAEARAFEQRVQLNFVTEEDL